MWWKISSLCKRRALLCFQAGSKKTTELGCRADEDLCFCPADQEPPVLLPSRVLKFVDEFNFFYYFFFSCLCIPDFVGDAFFLLEHTAEEWGLIVLIGSSRPCSVWLGLGEVKRRYCLEVSNPTWNKEDGRNVSRLPISRLQTAPVHAHKHTYRIMLYIIYHTWVY